MSLHSPLFAPLPALVDRDEHKHRPSLPMPLRYWNDDTTRDSSPSSSSSAYAPSAYHHSSSLSPRSSASNSPLVISLSPHPTQSQAPPPPYSTSHSLRSITPHPSSNPAIDLSSLIPLDSFASAESSLAGLASFGHAADDWTTYGFHGTDHRTLPPLNWADFGGPYGGYSPSSPYSASDSTTSSGSASPSYFLSTENAPTLPAVPPRQRGAPATNPDGTPAKKECFHCHVTTTPLWRREPQTQRPLCNACGLYLQQRNKLRPQELIDADRDDSDDEINRIPDSEYTGPKCSHCLTRQTSVWRRSKTGQQVCNACGVYARLRGKERPLSLRRNKIKPRTKHTR
ncbi:hypothetical protein C8F01DRAFT_1126441 [Mycena amicta]|nr:hypothetical protein C8F01DRAFT_1126441 [Mycena amicta]